VLATVAPPPRALVVPALLLGTGTAAVATAAENADTSLWENEGELGYASASGNTDTTTATARLASDREGEQLALHLLAEGRYSTEEGETTSERAHGRFQLDYNFSSRTYGFALAEATNDRFAGYEPRLQESLGAGRKFFVNREDLNWRVEGGPALRQEWKTNDSYENSVNARLRTLAEWHFGENSSLSEELIWTPSLQDSDNYLIMNETALRLRINSRLALKTSVRVEHDSEPPEGNETTDVWTTTSLLYSF
jgi:putative salt-induced outer membrane protein